MGIIYSDERSAGPVVPYHKMNANKSYVTHHGNKLTLAFIARESRDGRERAQAAAEQAVAERKMGFFERHPNFDWGVVRPQIEKQARDWRGRRKGR